MCEELIFVQIASYRDPELVSTIKDLLEKAKFSDRLRIGICRQYCDDDGFDNLDSYAADSRFRIIQIPFLESKGVCWARNQVQNLFRGEHYTLQIDSHMRFAPHWDEKLIDCMHMLEYLGHEKPMLTGYPPAYEPNCPIPDWDTEPPQLMTVKGFTEDGILLFSSDDIPDWQNLTLPIPARFYSAGFCFAPGLFCTEVQHDPDIYFYGEEMSITIRAFTHGYDLFHPQRTFVRHQYVRTRAPKHWDDNSNWAVQYSSAIKKLRRLMDFESKLPGISSEKYGFGNQRTFKDYEAYAGIDISARRIQKYTLDKKFPPNPKIYSKNDEETGVYYNYRFFKIKIFNLTIENHKMSTWVLRFFDINNLVIFEQQIDPMDVEKSTANRSNDFLELIVDFFSLSKPHKWVLFYKLPLKNEAKLVSELLPGSKHLRMSGCDIL